MTESYHDYCEREAAEADRAEAADREARFAPAGPTIARGPIWTSRLDYRSHPSLSTSKLKRFADCPETCDLEIETTAAMQFGCDLELYLWDAAALNSDIAIMPEAIKIRSGKAWDEFAAANEGKRILKSHEWTQLLGSLIACAIQLGQHEEAHRLLTDCGRPWPSFYWTCPCTVEGRKAELDILHHDCIVDLKTASDVSSAGWAAAAERLRYHWQAASYQDAVLACMGSRLPVVFVVVANKPPHNVEVYEMDDAWIEAGRQEVYQTIERYQTCRALGRWRSETHGKIIQLSRPRWAAYQGEYDV
jgi:hypothetical protein